MCHSSGKSQWTSPEFLFIQSKTIGNVASGECHLSEKTQNLSVNAELKLLVYVCSIIFEHFGIWGVFVCYVLFWGVFLKNREVLLFHKRAFCTSPFWLPEEPILPSLWQCFPKNLPVMELVVICCILARRKWCCGREGLGLWEAEDHGKSSTDWEWLESVVKLLGVKSLNQSVCAVYLAILRLRMWSGKHQGAAVLLWPCKVPGICLWDSASSSSAQVMAYVTYIKKYVWFLLWDCSCVSNVIDSFHCALKDLLVPNSVLMIPEGVPHG